MRNTFWRAALAACVLALPCGAVAGPIADAAATYEAQIAQGDIAAADATFEDMSEMAWLAAGLHMGTVSLVDAEPGGFGIYTERDGNEYAMGEPVKIYAEPKGYAHGKVAPGEFEIAFDVDLTLLDDQWNLMADVTDIMHLVVQSRARNREFFASLTYNITVPKPGKYVLRTKLRDRHSKKYISFDVPVVFVDKS